MAAPKRPTKTPPNPKVTPDSRDRGVEALRMKRDGYSYDEIAKALGYANRSGAFKAVESLLTSMEVESVESYRKVENERLDRLLRTHAQLADEGDTQAAQVVLGIVKERAKLNGLYAPVETKLSGGFGVTLDAIDEARAAAAANDPECKPPPPSPTSDVDTSTSAPGSSPGA